MLFITVQDALNTKLGDFASGCDIRRNIDGCSLISNLSCVLAEYELNKKIGMRLHRAEFTTIISPDDLQELLFRARDDGEKVCYHIEERGHENNSMMVYFTNIKATGRPCR